MAVSETLVEMAVGEELDRRRKEGEEDGEIDLDAELGPIPNLVQKRKKRHHIKEAYCSSVSDPNHHVGVSSLKGALSLACQQQWRGQA